ncbi:hypothetical protein BH11PSE11_BH11PSE11_10630 [soil metagenome]
MNTEEGSIDTLIGKKLHWTFSNGPTAGMTFEHVFYKNGNVSWRFVNGAGRPNTSYEKNCAVVKIAEDVFAVSYLAASGYTLSVVLNLQTRKAYGFASNGKEWYQQQGSFEVVGEAED